MCRALALLALVAADGVSDVTILSRFDELVGAREEVWVVVFSAGRDTLSSPIAAKAAGLFRVGRVDCAQAAEAGHAAASCARAKPDKPQILGSARRASSHGAFLVCWVLGNVAFESCSGCV